MCHILLGACNTDEPTSPSLKGQHHTESNSNSSTNSTSNNTDNDNYYFELEKPAAREINTEPGSIKIYFKCNQEYTISATGNVTGLRLSHNFGEGDGFVTVSFDKVQYKDSGSNITWNEYGYIIFTAKEGSKNNFKLVKNEYYIVRRGSHLNP